MKTICVMCHETVSLDNYDCYWAHYDENKEEHIYCRRCGEFAEKHNAPRPNGRYSIIRKDNLE